MPTENDKMKLGIDPRSQKIADKIKALRIEKGYTSHENFAWDFGINRVQYWRIEKGSNITIKTLLVILDIHGVTLSDFFKDID
jgi:Helix-turn-helix.